MKPLTIYLDGQSELAVMLRDALAGRSEAFAAGARVNTRIPSGTEPYGAVVPLVVVRQDGNGRDLQRVRDSVPYRVLVWHEDEDSAYDLSQLCHALVLAHDGEVISGVLAELTPFVTRDPDTDEPMATFTVIAKLRPALPQ
jgi:hypothetical protein